MQPLPLKVLQGNSHSTILAYPHGDAQEIRLRIKELEQLGVHSIYDFGGKPLLGLRVLGIGYCGVVVLARLSDQDVALKIRRTNAPKADFQNEAACLAAANQIEIGPKLLTASCNFLVMDYVAGDRFFDWIKAAVSNDDSNAIRAILKRIFQDCYKLDKIGLDHGNLRYISDHVIVSDESAVLIDFSSASRLRRPANVTSVAQGLFIGSKTTKYLAQVFSIPSKQMLIECLRHYKQQQTQQNFNSLLEVLCLS